MPEESIFHRLVKDENSYTQLLCNMVKRDGGFRSKFLSKCDVRPRDRVESWDIRTQVRLNKCGQADILIQSNGPDRVCIIVEVKTESHRGMTDKQKLLDHPASYQRWLEKQMADGSDAWLIFLVPASWKHRADKQQEMKRYREMYKGKGIHIHDILWEEVLKLLPAGDTKPETSLAHEFRLLLEERFGPIGFDKQETVSMFNDEFPMEQFAKLNALLDEIRKRASTASSRKTNNKKRRINLEIDKDEAGFWLPDVDLWIGYSAPFWSEGNPFPICFGVNGEKHRAKFRKAFYDEYKEKAKPFGGYTMGWVPKGDFEDPNAVEKIWLRLERIWDAVAETTR